MLKSGGPELTLFKFASRSQEIEDAKALQLRTFLTLQPDLTIKDLDASTEAEKNFKAIKAWLQDLYAKAERPLTILLDITCVPKTYLLYLIGLGFSDVLVVRHRESALLNTSHY